MPSEPLPVTGVDGVQVGGYRVRAIVDATLALDGGSMFGVVPKPLWERAQPADARNRIPLLTRLLYLEGHERKVLVDTGLGDRWPERQRDIFDVRPHAGGVVTQLEELGVGRRDITDVVLTHLHFDHAAGTTRRVDGALELTFPSARHHIQARQWDWAQRPSMKDAASFRADDFELLADDARLVLHDGDGPLFAGVEAVVLEGHTPGLQALCIGEGESTLFFPSDLVPTHTHLRWPYIMGFDNQPLVTLAEKQRLLPQAVEERWRVVFQHDPRVAAARLQLGERGVELAETIEL